MAANASRNYSDLLKHLSSLYDRDNRDTYLSIFVDLQDQNHSKILSRRIKEIRSALSDKEIADSLDSMFVKGMESISNLEGKFRSAAVFLQLNDENIHAVGLGARIKNSVILDASPYVLPLARFADEYEGFLLVLLDGQQSKIYHVEGAVEEMRHEHEHSAIGRHKKGGWSQMRYQRNREGVVKQFYDEISSQVDDLISELGQVRVMIAGPGAAKKQLLSRLSKNAQKLTIATEDADLNNNDKKLLDRFIKLAKEQEQKEEDVYIERLRHGLMKSGMAITGVKSVLEAAESGRVESLLVQKEILIPGLKCEPCVTYMFNQGENCPKCFSQGNEVDFANEAVEAAIRNSSHVEFIDDEFL
ncbi:MAG TPA: hypothetical protein EYQ73_06360, partial [Candidatus Poseidoniales archaeon]|nr:hypothetical protein [Candidatus Poseidoniales archaeon]